MSDRERQLAAYERNKRQSDIEKEIKPKRDWLPIFVSLCSLGISLTTAYFSVFLQEDDVRVVIERTPLLIRRDGELFLYGDQRFIFINSGNRSAALTSIESHARVLPSIDSDDRRCTTVATGPSVPIEFDAKPFVIKPGEILHISTRPVAEIPWVAEKTDGEQTVRLPKDVHHSNGAHKYLVCLTVSFVLPDSYVARWQQAVYFLAIGADKDDDFAAETALFEVGKPIVIAAGRRMRWGFW